MDGENKIQKNGLKEAVFNDSEVVTNLGENIIFTTEDKIRICLMNHLGNLEEKRGWLTPLGLFLTIILTFLTTDFKEWFLPKATWQAIFIILGFVFFLWLIIAIVKAIKAKTIEDILEVIKKSRISKSDLLSK